MHKKNTNTINHTRNVWKWMISRFCGIGKLTYNFFPINLFSSVHSNLLVYLLLWNVAAEYLSISETGCGELLGKMFLERIIENNKSDAYFRLG